MAHISKAIDNVRAEEAKRLKEDGYEPHLKKTRFILLKRASNLTIKQSLRLTELLQYNLKTVKAYILKEQFQQFWEYQSPAWAEKFLERWTRQVMYSKIEPMKDVAKMLRNHQELILNWFRTKGSVSQGIVEGFNGKAKVSIRKSYGFRTFRAMEVALYHALGKLPMPDTVPKFC